MKYKYEILDIGYNKTSKRQDKNQTPEDIFVLIHKANIKGVMNAIEKGVHIDHRNERDQNLILYSLLYKQMEIAKFLLLKGADLDARDISGLTARDIVKDYFPELLSLINESKITTHNPSSPSRVMLEENALTEHQTENLDDSQECSCIIQ